MVPYNSTDRFIQTFLKGLSLGESGNRLWEQTASLGVGGSDLSHCPVDKYGFPQWDGFGHPISHAAGNFQFEPRTWAGLAELAGLDFRKIDDQAKGAWLLAQQVFHSRNGGMLYSALVAKQYAAVQKALALTWTSVTGNKSSPTGLSGYLAVHL